MNYKKLPFLTVVLSVCLLFINKQEGFSQRAELNSGPTSAPESFENVYKYWFRILGQVRLQNNISEKDFETFYRFSDSSIVKERADFMKRIGTGEISLISIQRYEPKYIASITEIYKKFEKIKSEYPSSVEEFTSYRPTYLSTTCSSACDNIDFESGDLTGWNAYYGYHDSSSFNFTVFLLTGGPAGPVTQAANDPLTATTGFYNTGVGPNPQPDYQVRITSGTRGDALVPSVPVVSPFGGKYSVMLGDSTEVNYGVAVLSQTFLVGSSNSDFIYQYAVFLANPSHPYFTQPFFSVFVLDAKGDTIPYCGKYTVVSGPGIKGFDSIRYKDPYGIDTIPVYYKNWTRVNVPLTKYIGQCVTVVFEVADCGYGGHFGYAYIDASCAPLEIKSSSQNFCGQDSITLTGPAGEGHYYWTGPAGGIMSNDTLSQISVDSTGTYTLVVTPFTGASCKDTLTITIGKKTGPPPHPNFTADTGCAGSPTSFVNLSNPIIGANFYWDFYNNSNYEDSAVNPTWNYNLPGIYMVKLHEVYNGCGMDTIIPVVIDSVVSSSFIAGTVCIFDTTKFTNTSSGGINYYWNFGDPSSGVNNTSQNVNPLHRFTAPGTYTVSLIGKHKNWCNDTVKGTVVVLSLPTPTLTGSDSICSGSTAILMVSGGTSYNWSTGATTSTITVSPTVQTTYTVSVSNGKCSVDTSLTIYIKPLGTGTISGNNVCLGDTIHLSATGGGTYLWNTGATTSSISVVASSFSDTAYSVTITNGGTCLTLHQSIVIYPLPSGFVCCDTTIFSGSSVVLHGSGGTSYFWMPPGGLSCDTCPNPTVSPTVTTTYTLITTSSNGCSVESTVTVNIEIPCKDFFVPNVFSPNGDNINETFLIKVEFISQYEIWIYNRWGKLLFHSRNPDNPWDGNIDGSPAAQGVYYYIIKSTCETGNSFQKHGFLTLIR